ncbi:selenide, water dikinase SelD [Oceanicoccus sp. KOV_DT_Chl]|uniref:selenide, water dikinase SelD n=1 Tax=Oceanicoccus sp. KOV_DT_Chl TaxID=1904639 RepID=UPI000C7D6A26|nr:selenide, water dikinase SelD [Oceanicoccus sp. KOV_DT_Chl]
MINPAWRYTSPAISSTIAADNILCHDNDNKALMNPSQSVTDHHELLLVGGGHSHLAVIKMLAMQPIPGLQVTVISKDIHTPYSGMMPGMIAGHYSFDQAHIDLRQLCQYAGIRLIQAEVSQIDSQQQRVYCGNRAPLRYDYLSINIGSQPALASIAGADKCGIPVKPIATFLNYWQHILAQHQAADSTPQSVAIIGGGAASVEVALACQYQLQQQANPARTTIHLYCGTRQLLPGHNKQVQAYMTKRLAERGIELHLKKQVLSSREEDQQTRLQFGDHSEANFDHVIWAIHAGSPNWLAKTGLACNEQGFLLVNHYLQSSSHANVFAAGDIAHFSPQPLAKSGVYAVRAGQLLSENLRRIITAKPLKKFKPQRRFLSLLMTGDQQAIASKGVFSIAGKWVWRWKHRIDSRFMAMYQIPQQAAPKINHSLPTPEQSMRCGGCGAKIGSSILNRVMAQLDVFKHPDVPVALNQPDDAAVINVPSDKQWLQTVDYFRAFIDDPYLLGRIASNHCLSDIYAMGGTPHSALAIATVPYASDELVEDMLLQLMAGAVESLNQQQTALIGGHSNEGAELSFGLSVNGTIDPQQLLTKGQLQQGQALILSKPLGTGVLLAANMHAQAQGRWIEEAIKHMLISNQHASIIFSDHGASACTDITGFGLIGHLVEMLKAGQHHASIQLEQLPILNGATECAANGYLSSLHADNLKAASLISNATAFQNHQYYPLLFDPQTAGGLLAAVPVQQATVCLEKLQQSDCQSARIIGYISARNEHTLPSITLT